MTLPPGRFDYAPINDRPVIRWPNNARLAFWVAPNMEFFEYLPENRPTQPDIPFYSRMDYGNRVGFWRMLDVLNKHKLRACCCLNLEILDHFPEIKDAMVRSGGCCRGRVPCSPNRRQISAKNSMKSPGRTGLAFMKY